MKVFTRIISGIIIFLQLIIGGLIVSLSLDGDFQSISDGIFGADSPLMGSGFLDAITSWPFAAIMGIIFLLSFIKEFFKWKPAKLILVNLSILIFELIWFGYLYYMLWLLPIKYSTPV